MTDRTLIRGGCVLTLGRRTPNFASADVAIEDGRISEIGPNLRLRDAQVVDASNAIVMPGFVDTHRHAWKSVFRHHSGGGEKFVDGAGSIGPFYSSEEIYTATLVGLLGAAEAGITTVVDWCDAGGGVADVEAALQAHADAGLRTVYVHAGAGEAPADAIDVVRRLMTDPGVAGPRTSIAFGGAGTEPVEVDDLSKSWMSAREIGARIHAHAGVDARGSGAISSWSSRDLLGPDVTLVHCAHVSDEDLDAIQASRASVVLTPSTEMTDGMGMPPLQKLLDRKIRPGLGVDNEAEAPGDIFAQMRAANSVQHAAYFDLKLAGKAGLPNLLTTRDVIRYATVDGAHAIGLGDLTGSLEVGKAADIIVLRTDRPNIYPINDPIGAVVWGMDTSNLDWVFVGGLAVMRDGALDHDTSGIADAARSAREAIVARAGGTR